jgi:hypothetical protein
MDSVLVAAEEVVAVDLAGRRMESVLPDPVVVHLGEEGYHHPVVVVAVGNRRTATAWDHVAVVAALAEDMGHQFVVAWDGLRRGRPGRLVVAVDRRPDRLVVAVDRCLDRLVVAVDHRAHSGRRDRLVAAVDRCLDRLVVAVDHRVHSDQAVAAAAEGILAVAGHPEAPAPHSCQTWNIRPAAVGALPCCRCLPQRCYRVHPWLDPKYLCGTK